LKDDEKWNNADITSETRKKRYSDIINNSKQLKTENHDAYNYASINQLMRQTIWAEQMIVYSDVEKVNADDFIHIYVFPKENESLLKARSPGVGEGVGVEEIWRSLIKDQSKFKIITPEDLLKPICLEEKYSDLINYLEIRYW
jgi:hypothetical protein